MSNNFTLKEARKLYTTLLKGSDINEIRLECDMLLCHFLDVSRTFIISEPDYILPADVQKKMTEAINKRNLNQPIQYIIGSTNFMGIEFEVTPDVLIPRQDTEVLVEQVINFIGNASCLILDMCTGSGCIGISILKNCPNSKAILVDISKDAIEVAQRNGQKNNVDSRACFICSDFFKNIDMKYMQTFDAIVSNPPYITSNDILELNANVRDYEPLLALDGGIDGLNAYNKITMQSKPFLKPNGKLFFEVGYNQANDVMEIMKTNNFSEIEKRTDLNKIERIVFGTIMD